MNYVPPDPPGPRTYGIDVSWWQPASFPFQLAVRNGYQFAFIRASHGDRADGRYPGHREGALSANLWLGAYHYLTNDRAPARQAAVFYQSVAVAGGLTDGLGPALDVEQWGLTENAVRAWIEGLLAIWPVRIWLYTRLSYWRKAFGLTPWVAEYPLDLWIADYSWERLPDVLHPFMPPDWPLWGIWQYSSRAYDYPGYPAPLDKNLFSGPFQALAQRDRYDLTPGPWAPPWRG